MDNETRLREIIETYVPAGFRDDDGVWHEGPLRSEALAALRVTLAERDEWKQQAVAELKRSGVLRTERDAAVKALRDRDYALRRIATTGAEVENPAEWMRGIARASLSAADTDNQ